MAKPKIQKFGIWVKFKSGGTKTLWFDTEQERDYNHNIFNRSNGVKEIKNKDRK